MEKRPLNIAQKFLIRRIAEFPTLYPNGYAVIISDVIGTMGSCYWDKKGLLQMEDQHYNSKTKKWTKYPLRISLEAAESFLLKDSSWFPNISYNLSGPINNMPDNIHADWLSEISHVLWHLGKFDEHAIKVCGMTKCFLNWGVFRNPHSGEPNRYIDNFLDLKKKIPTWEARIKEIEYIQKNKRVNPEKYMGADI